MPTYKGRWHGAPFRDFKNKKYYITVELDKAPEIYDSTQEKDLAVSIETWAEGRSSAANRYYYELVGQIAAKLYTSKTEMHNWMLAEYGQPDTEADTILLDAEIDWRRVEALHLRPLPGQTIETEERTFQEHQVMEVQYI